MKLNIQSPLYVVGYAAGISAAFTAVVMAMQLAAAPRIRRNERLRRQKALVEVFGLGGPAELSPEATARLVGQRIDQELTVRDPQSGRRFQVFRAYDAEGRLVGVGFPVAGNGFWAPIRGLLALAPDLSEIVGVVFVEHSETPGLGGRITEAGFRDQFEGLDVSPPRRGEKFLYVERERPTSPQDPRAGRTVEAITGATQTSMAVGRFLNAELARFRRAMAARPREQEVGSPPWARRARR